MLWDIDETALFCLAVATFLAVIEICFRLGRRFRDRSDEMTTMHVGALQAAVLGLLALLLGFSFAMAASRFDARKTLIQEEVNAIGTTYLRAQLLPQPQRQECIELLRAFVRARIEFIRGGIDEGRLAAANADAARLEAQLWTLTRAMVAQQPPWMPTGLFIHSLNDMININEMRRAVHDNHVPEPVLQLLFSVALGALGFIAYGYGLAGRRRHASTAIFALLIALVLATILDLDRPRRGVIQVSEDGMLRLQATMEQNPL